MGYWAPQNAIISQITLRGRANGEKLWREDGNGTKGAYMCDQAINLQVMDVTLSHAHREIKDSRQDGVDILTAVMWDYPGQNFSDLSSQR